MNLSSAKSANSIITKANVKILPHSRQFKLSDIWFSLKTPSLLRSEHGSRNRLWCMFYNFNLQEISSSFALFALAQSNFFLSSSRRWRKYVFRGTSPWFGATEKSSLNVRSKPVLGSTKVAFSSLHKPGKSQKLNPKMSGRLGVGQGRKIKLEMDKRGDVVANSIDVSRHNLVGFGNLVAERKPEKKLRWETKLS